MAGNDRPEHDSVLGAVAAVVHRRNARGGLLERRWGRGWRRGHGGVFGR